ESDLRGLSVGQDDQRNYRWRGPRVESSAEGRCVLGRRSGHSDSVRAAWGPAAAETGQWTVGRDAIQRAPSARSDWRGADPGVDAGSGAGYHEGQPAAPGIRLWPWNRQ